MARKSAGFFIPFLLHASVEPRGPIFKIARPAPAQRIAKNISRYHRNVNCKIIRVSRSRVTSSKVGSSDGGNQGTLLSL
jgi:hypothetical protein